MGNKKPNIPKHLRQGKTARSQEAQVPIAQGGAGRVNTSLNIRWTKGRAIFAAALLGVPFLLATVAAFKSGNILVGCILVAVAIFFGLIYLALRYIEENDF